LSTSFARAILLPLEKHELVLVGRMSQADLLTRCIEQLGYMCKPRSSSFSTTRRLSFVRTGDDQTIDVYLDTFSMYHRLDLSSAFAQQQIIVPEAFLILQRLQLVEINESALRDICALLLEHDLSVGSEKEKIDASQITRLCADDWGWYKTVSMNLDRVSTFAAENLLAADRAVVTERARRLKQNLNDAPKSLRWQTRARLGENMRWYDTPVIGRPSGRPDMAFG
jgi:hypothetical protein